MPRNSIADQLNIADIRIGNSLSNEDIKTEVAKKGYSEAKLLDGKALVESARTAVKNQVSLDGKAQNATKLEEKCKEEAHKAYQDLAKTARAKYKPGSPELIKLGLTGAEPKATAEFIKAGYVLIDNAKNDPDISAKLSENGYTEPVFTSERAKITAYEQANKDQISAKGNAEEATNKQTNALKAMNDWVSEYTKIARIALGNNNKLLEKIGIFTGNRSKKKNDKKDNPPQQ